MRCELNFAHCGTSSAAPTWMVSSVSRGITTANTPQTLQVVNIINTPGANNREVALVSVFLSQWEAMRRPEIPSVAQTLTDAKLLQRSSS